MYGSGSHQSNNFGRKQCLGGVTANTKISSESKKCIGRPGSHQSKTFGRKKYLGVVSTNQTISGEKISKRVPHQSKYIGDNVSERYTFPPIKKFRAKKMYGQVPTNQNFRAKKIYWRGCHQSKKFSRKKCLGCGAARAACECLHNCRCSTRPAPGSKVVCHCLRKPQRQPDIK